MKPNFWVKFVLGLMLVAFLIALCYKMSDYVISLFGDIKGGDVVIEDDYENELHTPEPAPTMPEYMQDDSFYDSAGAVDFDGE